MQRALLIHKNPENYKLVHDAPDKGQDRYGWDCLELFDWAEEVVGRTFETHKISKVIGIPFQLVLGSASQILVFCENLRFVF